MSETAEVEYKDFRVMYAYLDQFGHDRYEFTTVLAQSPEEAELVLTNAHGLDYGFEIVQTVESNGEATGFTDEQREEAVKHAADLKSTRPSDA